MRDDYKPFFKSIQVFYNKRLFSFVLKDFPRDCLNIAYASQYVYYKAKTNYYEVLKVNIKEVIRNKIVLNDFTTLKYKTAYLPFIIIMIQFTQSINSFKTFFKEKDKIINAFDSYEVNTDYSVGDKFKYDGVGIMLGKGADSYSIVGIDLDHVLLDTSPNKSNIDNIVKTLNSYTELSPSKTGIHILLKVKDDENILRAKRTEVNGDSFEFYKADRFFTLTGNKYKIQDGKTFDELRTIEPNELKDILKNTLGLDLDKGNISQNINLKNKASGKTAKELHENILKENFEDIGSQGLTTEKILSYIFNEPDGNKYVNILLGYTRGFRSQSELDFAICKKLAFYTDSPKQINDIIVNSGLVRDKWFEQRGDLTYGVQTILKAINATKHKFGEKFKSNNNDRELER